MERGGDFNSASSEVDKKTNDALLYNASKREGRRVLNHAWVAPALKGCGPQELGGVS